MLPTDRVYAFKYEITTTIYVQADSSHAAETVLRNLIEAQSPVIRTAESVKRTNLGAISAEQEQDETLVGRLVLIPSDAVSVSKMEEC